MKTKLYIVIPCYNEQEVLPTTSHMFLVELLELIKKGKISDESRILFVNDGSKDTTWEIITELSKKIPILSVSARAEIEVIKVLCLPV